MTFGVIAGYPELHVLDSTLPSQVRVFEDWVELPPALFMVANTSRAMTKPLVF